MKRMLALILVLLATTALYGCDLIGNVPVTTYELVGPAEQTIEVDGIYQEQGTTYPTPADVVITGTVDTSTIGTYTVTYQIPLEDNAALTLTRTVTVVDTTAPTITLIGGAVNLQVGGTFTDPGATANDNYDGDISGDIVVSGTVNTSAVGTYTLTYNVEDSSGNAATPKTRTVTVGEAETNNIPVITLTGSAAITIYVGDTYTDAGATASDTEDGNLTASILVTGTVNTATAGVYVLTYNVTDSHQNPAVPVTRTVTVLTNQVPELVLLGLETITLQIGSVFTDPGATATDYEDGNLDASIVVTGTVDTSTPGTYLLYYDVTDSRGQDAPQVMRTVVVIDDDPPQMDVYVMDPVLYVGDTYNEQGASAIDDLDGDISNLIIITGSVDTTTAGVYPITYTVTDSTGHTIVKTSYVQVVDPSQINTHPEIYLTDGTIVLFVGDTYQEPGFTASDKEDGDITNDVIVDDSQLNTSIPGIYEIFYTVTDSGYLVTTVVRVIEVYPVGTDLSPMIHPFGEEHMKIPVGGTYNEPGAEAWDPEDGDISQNIVITGSVNTAIEGTYYITYTVTDSGGNTVHVQRIVEVIPDQSPVIEVHNPFPILVMGEMYFEQGATAWDVEDGNISHLITITGMVNTFMMGQYPITYTVTDSAGNTTTVVNVVTVTGPNNTAPQLDLVGPNIYVMVIGDVYTELGATAYDAEEGDISGSVVIDDSNVDWNTPGEYVIEYYVEDNGFLWAMDHRFVQIFPLGQDLKPMIALIGQEYLELTVGDAYNEEGAEAFDYEDGDITMDIIITGFVDTSTPGGYTVTYTVTDSAGNTAEMQRYIQVVDDQPPHIEIRDWHPIYLVGDTYTENGAVAWDQEDGDITANIIITGTVDTSTVGTYVITYTVTDSAGHTVSIDNLVVVTTAGNHPPYIELIGPQHIQIVIGDSFTDPGATAWDGEDGDITNLIVVDYSQVNWTAIGWYEIFYEVTDSEGLWMMVSRVIEIVPLGTDLLPVITLNGPQYIELFVGDTYTEQGATAYDHEDGDITNLIQMEGYVDTSTTGYYHITYRVIDSAGHGMEISRDIYVRGDEAPYIDVPDWNPIVFLGDSYVHQEATAYDAEDGDLSHLIVVTGTVDTNTIGSYPVVYQVTDSYGNTTTITIHVSVTTAGNTPPFIDMIGPFYVQVIEGTTFLDPGVTAWDTEDGDITANIVVDDSGVDWNTPGWYQIYYTITDSGGLMDMVLREIEIVPVGTDLMPVITLIGPFYQVLDVGVPYVEQGATALDFEDGDLTHLLTIDGQVNVMMPGIYHIWYRVTDSHGNEASMIRAVEVRGNQAPDISPNNPEFHLYVGDTYVEEGAWAYDLEDGDLSDHVVITGTVDTSTTGTYIITYCVTDSGGLESCVDNPVYVTLAGDERPWIELVGPTHVTLVVGDTYIEQGATATDTEDGDLSNAIVIDDSQVDWNTPGWYYIKYTVSDSGGWTVVIERHIQIVPVGFDFPPIITLLGDEQIWLTVGEPYVEAGATAWDNEDGDISNLIVILNGNIDTNIPDFYVITYQITDSYGNVSEVQRIVDVLPDWEPSIEPLDRHPIYYVGDTYVEYGAYAYDTEDGDISHLITTSGTVDTTTMGTYIITYTVTDSAGNTVHFNNTVTVTSPGNTAPQMELVGVEHTPYIIGDPWIDPGAIAFDLEDGDITSWIVVDDSEVDWNTPGTYRLFYRVTDSGMITEEAYRIIDVFDMGTDLIPVIVLNGEMYVYLFVNDVYTELGATAWDYEDGDLTNDIVISGVVDTSVDGIYYVSYEVYDSYGNSYYIERVVYVKVDNPPMIWAANDYLTVVRFETYHEYGASAYDDEDGDLDHLVVITGSVDTNIVGSYHVNYCVTDSANQTVCTNTTVYVVAANDDAPVIDVLGDQMVIHYIGDAYVDMGATAADTEDGDLTGNIITDMNDVDWNTPGYYRIVYAVVDSGNWHIQAYRYIQVVPQGYDFPPEISVNGGWYVELTVGGTYTEQGATASDVEDGDLSQNVVITGTVDTSIIGEYELTYTVTDSGGNTAVTTRIVNVMADQAPELYVNYPDPIYIVGQPYYEGGATAIDDVDGNISNQVVITGTVDTNTVGFYEVTYTVTDSAGHTTVVSTTVTVLPSE